MLQPSLGCCKACCRFVETVSKSIKFGTVSLFQFLQGSVSGEAIELFGWDESWKWRQCFEPRPRAILSDAPSGYVLIRVMVT